MCVANSYPDKLNEILFSGFLVKSQFCWFTAVALQWAGVRTTDKNDVKRLGIFHILLYFSWR